MGFRKKWRNGLASTFGGIVAAATMAFVWTLETPESEANGVAAAERTQNGSRSASKGDALTRLGPGSPQFTSFEDYFDTEVFARYGYVSPPRSSWWAYNFQPVSAQPSTRDTGPAAFAMPSAKDVSELYKAPALSRSMPPLELTRELNLASKAAVFVSLPSPPISVLANPTPFHLFVTSEPVAPSSAASSSAFATSSTSSLATSGSLSSSLATPSVSTIGTSGAIGAVTPVGTLLRR